jgi:hypothetical protein
MKGIMVEKEGNFFVWNEVLFFVAETIFFMIIYRYNMFFVFLGLGDFSRRLTATLIVGSLICPIKDRQYPFLEAFPTVDLADGRTLHSWLNLRLAVTDFGKKYTTRVQLYSTIFFLMYACIALFFAVALISTGVALVSPQRVIILFDLAIIMFLLLNIFRQGSLINKRFSRDSS